MGDPTRISGAVLGAIVQELVQLAKTAHRCQGNCNKLIETLEYVAPIGMKLAQSSGHRSIECENWLHDFLQVLENAKEVVSHCTPCPWWKPITYMSRVKLSKRLVSIDALINAKVQEAGLFQFDMIDEIYQRGKMKDLIVEEFVSHPTPKVIVDFKENVLEKLLRLILFKGDVMEEPMTIGLKGQGGVGKTLLANMVYNDKSVQEKFGSDCMLYVTIGLDTSISSLYKVLAKGLGVGGEFNEEYALRQEEDQRSYLMEIFLKKKVFLVLDDAWENGGIISWLDIAKGLGSITLVTTRNKVVLSNMKANVILDVEYLSEEESWKLFRIHAFGTNLPPHEIEEVALELCAECNGLPLALEVIGSLMWEKKDVRLWKSTLTLMKKSQKMCNSNIEENRLFNCLRYSYDEMDSASKKCFLYVAAYPQNYAIPIDEICSIWVKDDIFKTFEKEERMQFAYDHLTSLGDRSMIEIHEDSGTVKVHDIVRDFAIRIIHDANLDEWASGCYIHSGKILKKLPPKMGVMKRMSLIGSTILDLPVESPNSYMKLTTRCMEQVDGVVGVYRSSMLNQAQCQYLVEKLKLTLQSAKMVIGQVNEDFISLSSLEDMEQLTLIFKLLYVMGKEVEDFIQNCCKKTWIQSAVMLTNVSEHVVTVGFNLECCLTIFSKRKLETSTSLGLSEIASLHKSQAEVVREKASQDKANMMASLQVALRARASSNIERELASYLLQKLNATTHVGSSSFGSNERSSLEMQGQVGKGTSANVYKATWYGLEVAMKTFCGPENKDFLHEVKLLEGLSHPNIVSILWYTTNARRCHLIMELMDKDLNHLIEKKMEESGHKGYPFSIYEALDLMLQIANGMLYLHEKGIVHRDLKSSNILIRSKMVDKVDINYLQAKVADFGLAQTKEINMSYSSLTQNVGTTRWMAPEVIGVGSDEFERKVGSKYPFKVDIYSYGMVCYEILSGDVPFSNLTNGDAKKAALAGKRPFIPTHCPQRVKFMIEACWKPEASTRPCFGDICEELRATIFANINKCWVSNISNCSRENKATKKSIDDQTCFEEEGTISHLLGLLLLPNEMAQMDVISALLNLSHDNNNTIQMIAAGAVEPILKVLNLGDMKTKECVATILFNLSLDDETKFTIGNSGAIHALVTLL